jgi:hypothetical protein
MKPSFFYCSSMILSRKIMAGEYIHHACMVAYIFIYTCIFMACLVRFGQIIGCALIHVCVCVWWTFSCPRCPSYGNRRRNVLALATQWRTATSRHEGPRKTHTHENPPHGQASLPTHAIRSNGHGFILSLSDSRNELFSLLALLCCDRR